MKDTDETETLPQAGTGLKALRIVVGLVVAAALITCISLAIMYFSTPAEIRKPSTTHFHFRLDLIVDGKPVNFAEDKFQTEFSTDICSAALTKQPVHFHDHVNQFVHIHWAGITGGEVLKDYGWNFIGGLSNTLGWRFDQGNFLTRVGIHGIDFPSIPSGDQQYVYVGDASRYNERTWDSFIHQPVHEFFGAPAESVTHVDTEVAATSADEQKLIELNHVVGSVVIFVQKDKPTDAQIKDRFSHLEPFPQSQCAG